MSKPDGACEQCWEKAEALSSVFGLPRLDCYYPLTSTHGHADALTRLADEMWEADYRDGMEGAGWDVGDA